jgi:hypothetical protein
MTNLFFFLQKIADEELRDLQASTVLIGHQLQWLNIKITNFEVTFMNTADVTVVVMVLVNFQFQIVLDL